MDDRTRSESFAIFFVWPPRDQHEIPISPGHELWEHASQMKVQEVRTSARQLFARQKCEHLI
jgi:hypothetical protein